MKVEIELNIHEFSHIKEAMNEKDFAERLFLRTFQMVIAKKGIKEAQIVSLDADKLTVEIPDPKGETSDDPISAAALPTIDELINDVDKDRS